MTKTSEGHSRRGWRRFLVDTTPLRVSPAFARLWIGTSVAQIGAQVTIVAVGLHVYALTMSTFAVALVALWAIGPMIVAGFLGGMLSDRYDRRLVALVTSVLAWLSIGTMTTIAFLGVSVTWPYYALAAVNAAAATIMGAARGAILPRLLPSRLLPAAAALGGITMGLAVTVGPAIAGVMVAFVGFSWTYLVDAVLFTAAFIGIVGLPAMKPEVAGTGIGFGALVDSLRFLRKAPNVRATFVFDIIAMTLGAPRVIFPAVGALLLGGGAVTVGVLTAAFAVGALLSSLLSGPLGAVRRQGRAVTIAIAAYGVSTAAFGAVLFAVWIKAGAPHLEGSVSADATGAGVLNLMPDPIWWALILACLTLAAAGAADNISAIFRTTILQVAAPDSVRGRIQGLFYVVVAGGPRVGDLVTGAAATAIALWAPPLFGGALIVLIMFVFARVYRGFQTYDSVHPTP